MSSRNELVMRARVVGFDASTIPNDSKLEQKVLFLEKNAAAKTGTAAVSTLTSDNTEVADGDTVTIGLYVYRFKDTMTQAFDVQRNGTTADTTLASLRAAINGNGTPGTDYFVGGLYRQNPHVSCGAVTAHAVAITSRDTNSGADLATTTTATHLSWTGSTLNAGTPGVAGVIVAVAGNAADGSSGGVSGSKNTSI